MPTEKLLIYLVAGAILLLKFLADAFQRRREQRIAQQAAHEPGAWEQEAQEPGMHRWDPLRDAGSGESRTDAVSSHVVRPARTPERSASRPARPSHTQSVARPQTPVRVEPARRHRIALRDPAELRRAVELMAILGPPRSRVPDDA